MSFRLNTCQVDAALQPAPTSVDLRRADRVSAPGLERRATASASLSLWPSHPCRMRSASERLSVVDGLPTRCPWCGGRAVVSLWRARASHAQLQSKPDR